MLFPNNRNELRTIYFNSWKKHQQKLPLTAVEAQLVAVILDHPEYHPIFDHEEEYVEKEYLPEMGATNPFLHMGLHLAIRDQIATNRPIGIKRVYRQLLTKYKDPLIVEHHLMQVLAETLWQMQRNNRQLNEADYLRDCKKLL
jgi:hypothetical protein